MSLWIKRCEADDIDDEDVLSLMATSSELVAEVGAEEGWVGACTMVSMLD